VVCVPARDEAARLPALIAALDAQTGLGAGPVRAVLLLNNSADASRHVAERAGARTGRLDLRIIERSFPPEHAHAGSARRAAMEAGAAWLAELGARDGMLLTTDADAMPAGDWIARSRAVLEAGADIAAARLVGDPVEEATFSARLRQAIRDRLRAHRLAVDLEDAIDPVPGDTGPRHWDHSGGGLALRLETYHAAGGCPALPFREDLALVQSVRVLGGIVRHCPSLRVTVSARMQGRAAGGMADTLGRWARVLSEGGSITAPDPAVMEARWRTRARMRRRAMVSAGGMSDPHAARIAAAEVARHCPDPVDSGADVPVGEAIGRMERRLHDLLRARTAA
jgi:hypothetical protein